MATFVVWGMVSWEIRAPVFKTVNDVVVFKQTFVAVVVGNWVGEVGGNCGKLIGCTVHRPGHQFELNFSPADGECLPNPSYP